MDFTTQKGFPLFLATCQNWSLVEPPKWSGWRSHEIVIITRLFLGELLLKYSGLQNSAFLLFTVKIRKLDMESFSYHHDQIIATYSTLVFICKIHQIKGKNSQNSGIN